MHDAPAVRRFQPLGDLAGDAGDVVDIQAPPGDELLEALPFDEGRFDSAVSTNVYDHLGKFKQQALSEVFRVLKPGGRFLMAVWVPGWAMFAIANVLSFFLTSREEWRTMARRAGFEVIDEGAFNHAWFALLKKPAVLGA